MFSLKKTDPKPTAIDEAIERLVSQMDGYDTYSDEYTKMVANLKVLTEANEVAKTTAKPDIVSANTAAMIAGNLVGIVLILSFEKANVITSKSLSFVLKPRI